MKSVKTMALSMAVGLVAVGSSHAARFQVDLNYNFNGIVHAGEDENADAPNGYRSISDRGLDFTAGVPADPTLDQFNIVGDPGVLDIVHLGNRNTVTGGLWAFEPAANGNDVGTQPTWLADPDQTGPQTTTLGTPLLLDSDSSATVLFQISDGGGEFDVRVGFDSGADLVQTLGAGDWFGGPAPGTDSVDRGRQGGAGLHINGGVIDLSAEAGRSLTSITFENRSNDRAGYAIIAANVDAVPEPSALAICLLAFAACGMRRR